MSLTLSNAALVLDHHQGRAFTPGYTRARHHIGHVSPGDLWRPDPDGPPRTVTALARRSGRIVLIDQYGVVHRYQPGAVIDTAVLDPRFRSAAPAGFSRLAA